MDYKGAALAKTPYIEKFISKFERVARAVYPPQKCPPHGVGATIFAKMLSSKVLVIIVFCKRHGIINKVELEYL